MLMNNQKFCPTSPHQPQVCEQQPNKKISWIFSTDHTNTKTLAVDIPVPAAEGIPIYDMEPGFEGFF